MRFHHVPIAGIDKPLPNFRFGIHGIVFRVEFPGREGPEAIRFELPALDLVPWRLTFLTIFALWIGDAVGEGRQ